jgi:hypothetical protein
MRIERFHVVSIVMSVLLCVPAFVGAAGIPEKIVTCQGINCTCADLTTVAQNIINLSIFVAIFLSAILFAWAGWKMISGRSMGSHGAIDEGKEVLWNVVIGLVIIIAAWLIVDTIVKTITASGTVKGVWNSICPSR